MRRIGRHDVARAARPAVPQRIDVRHARQQRELRERMRQREHGATIEHRANPLAERADRQITEHRIAERGRERRAIVGRDGPRVELAAQRMHGGLHPRDGQVARDDPVRADAQHEHLELVAQHLAALDDRDLQRAAALPAQRVHVRAKRFELRMRAEHEYRGRGLRARARGDDGRIVVDDLPAVRHAARAVDHRAADHHAILVTRELHPARRFGRAAVDARRQPAARREAQRPHLAGRERVARAPEIDDPQQLAMRALQLRDARADAVKAAARRAIGIAHERRIVGARVAARAGRFGVEQQHERDPARAAPVGQRVRFVRERDRIVPAEPALGAFDEIQRTGMQPVALHRAQAAGQPRERARCRATRRAAGRTGIHTVVGRPGRRRHRQYVQVARPAGRLRAAREAERGHLRGDARRIARQHDRDVARARLARAFPHERIAARRAGGRVDRIQAAGFQLRPGIGQAVDREPAQRAGAAARRPHAQRRAQAIDQAGGAGREAGGIEFRSHGVPLVPSNPNKAAPASA
ncbi:transcriptional regulatory protein DcuR [Burkholderia cenocepacia]|nr:transcriptional regulatory protein DcuR [Burkholderia cenocepacia]